jgi:3-hydroxyacyl-CoA dehydrogenase
MGDAVTRVVEDGIGVVIVDSPPVNALGASVRKGLLDCFTAFAGDDTVEAIVLICAGRTFIAGADISEFGKPDEGPGLQAVFDIIEHGVKPVVAAIHGTALGGGLETALICPFRIAVPSARMGLPEVNLGLLPGAGGTQRLPRVVGPEVALDLITSGRSISAKEALFHGLVDALAAEGGLREDAIAFARSILAENRPVTRIRDRQDKVEAFRGDPSLFDNFRKQRARAFRGFKAPENIIKAIEAAVNLSFEEGLKREWELFSELVDSTESRAQRYVFFAERATSKIPDVPKDEPVVPVASVAIIGAGTMGGGIAMNFLNKAIPVTLVEQSQPALDRGVETIRRNYQISAKKGRLSEQQVEERIALIRPTLEFADLAGVDLVIEAAFEEMSVKKDIFSRLDQVARPGAILATNTSFLDVAEIASVTSRPQDVIGLHFFSPANVMRLLEVVRTDETARPVLATAMALAKHIGKVPVVSRVCHGFIANRLMTPRGRQADALLMQGVAPGDVDRAIYSYGFAMGHYQMLDLVGLDVIGRESKERTLTGDMVANGRLGQKQGGGFYDYDDERRSTASPVVQRIIDAFARSQGVKSRVELSDEEIVAWLLYPVVNEGVRILEEGVALRASDIDIAAILGYNWPEYTGGPMCWADTVGLAKIVDRLTAWQARHGDFFAPSPMLVRLAEKGGALTHV